MTVFDIVRKASDACVLADPQMENTYFFGVYIHAMEYFYSNFFKESVFRLSIGF